MRLAIGSFADRGDISRERLVIDVLFDLDIGNYVALRSRSNDGISPTSGQKIAYWFPDRKIAAGDIVVLYSKAGESSTKRLSSGKTAHFYYWGQSAALWGTSDHSAVLLRVSEWIHRIPERIE